MIALTTAEDQLAHCEPERCPLCDTEHYEDEDSEQLDRDESIEAAVHCCMWKRVDHPTRLRIAGRLQSGANWLEALTAENAA